MNLVADTSGLVSIASTENTRQVIVPLLLQGYDVTVPTQVIDELETIVQYDDTHGIAAQTILTAQPQLTIEAVDLDSEFPLDDGENAVVQLANRIDAGFCYCDEYNQLALIYALLSDTQLVTTPRLLKAFVVHGECSNSEAKAMLDDIAQCRSWDGNAYVHQVTQLFE